MIQKKYKRIGIILGICLLGLILLYQLLGMLGGNPIRIRLNLYFQKSQYNEITEKFLSQKGIMNIAINSNREILNGCSVDYSKNIGWSCFEGGVYKNQSQNEISFRSIDDVLNYLKIPKEEYVYYSKFLKEYHLDGIGKDDEKGLVELSDGLSGLRYYKTPDTTDFVIDEEYLTVTKLDNHWFYFSRDWN